MNAEPKANRGRMVRLHNKEIGPHLLSFLSRFNISSYIRGLLILNVYRCTWRLKTQRTSWKGWRREGRGEAREVLFTALDSRETIFGTESMVYEREGKEEDIDAKIIFMPSQEPLCFAFSLTPYSILALNPSFKTPA